MRCRRPPRAEAEAEAGEWAWTLEDPLAGLPRADMPPKPRPLPALPNRGRGPTSSVSAAPAVPSLATDCESPRTCPPSPLHVRAASPPAVEGDVRGLRLARTPAGACSPDASRALLRALLGADEELSTPPDPTLPPCDSASEADATDSRGCSSASSAECACVASAIASKTPASRKALSSSGSSSTMLQGEAGTAGAGGSDAEGLCERGSVHRTSSSGESATHQVRASAASRRAAKAASGTAVDAEGESVSGAAPGPCWGWGWP